MTYNSIYTGPQVDDAVDKRHAQNTDTALDTGGANAITAAVLAELANAERRDQFYDSLLKPAGLTVAPDVLYWPSPYRADQMDATIARPGTGTRFNSQGVLETIAANIIRRDYDPVGGFRGALAEPQRENLLLWSEAFDNAAWAKSATTVSADAAVAPDGMTTADKLVETAATAAHFISQSQSVTTDLLYSQTVYAKAGERSVLQFAGSTGFFSFLVNFDLAAGVISSNPNALAASIEPVGNDWYRCSVTASAISTNASGRIILALANAPTSVRLESYAGDGTSGIYIWGAQLEQAAFPSSYMKTESTTVTRPADTLTIPQVGDRRRGFICWEGVPVIDVAGQQRQFPFGGGAVSQGVFLGNGTVRGRNTTDASGTSTITLQTSLQQRLVRIAYWWDTDADVFGASCDGLSAELTTADVGIPIDVPIRFGQTTNTAQGASHTNWIFISYNIPPIAQIEALTGGVL